MMEYGKGDMFASGGRNPDIDYGHTNRAHTTQEEVSTFSDASSSTAVGHLHAGMGWCDVKVEISFSREYRCLRVTDSTDRSAGNV